MQFSEPLRPVNTLVRARRRHSAIGLTRSKREQVRALAVAFTAARQGVIEAYWAPLYASAILSSPRAMIQDRRRNGTLKQAGLTTHYSALATASAFAALKGSWQTTIAEARDLVSRNPNLTDAERHWLRYVLRWPAHLQTSLDGKTVRLEQDWAAAIDEGLLSRKLRRLILRHRASLPGTPKSVWLELDTNCYRAFARPNDRAFKGAWLAVTGSGNRRRINIPLAGRGLDEFKPRTQKENSRPGLRVSISGDRIVFNLVEHVAVATAVGAQTAGIDKGYRTLVTLSISHPESALSYGHGEDVTIAAIAEAQTTRLKHRRRLAAYERSVRNTDVAKARRIRRNNLHRTKLQRRSEADTARLRQDIGRALNEMFASNPHIGVINCEALDFVGNRLARTPNRRLGRWLKGYLQSALTYKAELHGVKLNVVNAAYTSQTCPRCGYLSQKNRSGERFLCRACSYTAGADAVAATNVLRRGSDPAITRRTSKGEVRQILEARWRSAPIGGAWDSPSSGTRHGETSRDQLLTLLASVGA